MKKEETIQSDVFELTGRNFKDINGKSKHLRKTESGKLVHTGNLNYIITSEGVIHHQTNKIFKRTAHISGFNKII